MRVKRINKFKKFRRNKFIKMFMFLFIIPLTSVVLGYFITALVILPLIVK